MKLMNLPMAVATIALSAAATFAGNALDLSLVTSNTVVQDGDTLTDSLTGNFKISVADSATVTLNGAIIVGEDDEAYPWAGITCEGNCTIVLNGDNKVRGFYNSYPGIYVPSGSTLTIKGDGSLDVGSNGKGAGIGCGKDIDCGNIEIEGGSIVAKGARQGAAIGGAPGGSVGNITISGGVIETRSDSSFAAGIGCGALATAGNISIVGGTVKAVGSHAAAGIGGIYCSIERVLISGDETHVEAVAGAQATYSIGIVDSYSENDIINHVFIAGVETGEITDNRLEYPFTETYTIHFDKNGGEGTMEDQSAFCKLQQVLTENAFTKNGSLFAGWNTEADGSGTHYVDMASVRNLAASEGEITLYAQWFGGNLAELKGDYRAHDGDTLTDSLAGYYKISIADGATVTLDSVIIEGVNNDAYKWAGISCEGNCTIVLMGANRVKGFYQSYPGIHVPINDTLTIKGIGSLDASGIAGAGIGGGLEIDCGNIVIESGIITASSRYTSAGIGSGQSASCQDITISGGIVSVKAGTSSAGIGGGLQGSVGNITISGGTVTAVGSENGNGGGAIGGGYRGSAGYILITDSVTKVIAKISNKTSRTIGTSEGSCGTIRVADIEYPDGVSDTLFIFETYDVVFNSNGGAGSMDGQRLIYGRDFVLTENKFTRSGYVFDGWNTKVDGTGLAYDDKTSVKNLTDVAGDIVTLYAQWAVIVKQPAKLVTAPSAIKDLAYTGKAQTLIVAGDAEHGKIMYKLDKEGKFTEQLPKATKAGVYTIYYKVIGDENYEDLGVDSLSVKINRLESKLVAAPSPVKNLVYTGQEQDLVVAGRVEHGKILYKLGKNGQYMNVLPAATDAGEYTVYYQVKGDENYYGIGEKSFTVEIKKAPAKLLVAPTPNKELYDPDREMQLVWEGKAENGTLLYKVGVNGTYSSELPTVKKSGEYKVFYKVKGNKNYSDVEEAYVIVRFNEYKSALARTRLPAEQYKMARDFDLKGRKLQGKPTARGAYCGRMNRAE